MRASHLLFCSFSILVLNSCALLQQEEDVAQASRPTASPVADDPPTAAPEVVAQPTPSVETPATRKPTSVPRAQIKPMPVRPLQVQTDCRFRNETGYHGEATLEVRDGTVRRFRAIVNPPQGGSCLFELAGMRQTKTLPNVELRGMSNACTVRMWEQGRQVTVAFSDCAAQCAQGAFKYVWPILVDRPTGKCV